MANGQHFYCVTAPCGTGDNTPGNPFVPFSTSPGVGSRLGFGSALVEIPGVSPAIDMALLAASNPAILDAIGGLFDGEASRPETSLPDVGGDLPTPAPPPVRVPGGIPDQISPEEMREIDEALRVAEESERPFVRVTQAEADAFIRDRDSILARTGRDPDSLPPELNPILLITGGPVEDDESPEKEEPSEHSIDVLIPRDPTRVGPPVLLGGVDQTAGALEPGARESEFGEQPMADLSDIFGALGDRIVGSLDFDPSTPGIFGGGASSSLPDIIGDAFSGSVPATSSPVPRSTPVQVNIDPVTGKVTRCRRRRRRRLLTKSDIADISTMAALLGKNSESFKVWLAKATR